MRTQRFAFSLFVVGAFAQTACSQEFQPGQVDGGHHDDAAQSAASSGSGGAPETSTGEGGEGDAVGSGGNGSGSGGEAATTSGTGGAETGEGGAGGDGATTTAGSGGSTSSTGSTLCDAGSQAPCYDGPVGTEGVGACKGGVQTCNPEGTAYGPCVGQVLPQEETCTTSDDDDCDGELNEGGAGCVCVPGSTAACYSGPAGTQNVGMCVGGTKTCNDLGTDYGACVGEVTPVTESCSAAGDEDCNGSGCSDPIWTKRFGGPTTDSVRVAVDADGNLYVAGSFSTSINLGDGDLLFSAGSTDVYVAKYDANGSVVWKRRFGDDGAQTATAITVDEDKVFVAGSFKGDMDEVHLSGSNTSQGFVFELEASSGEYFGSGKSSGARPRYITSLDSYLGVLVAAGYEEDGTDCGSGTVVIGCGDLFMTTMLTNSAEFVTDWQKVLGRKWPASDDRITQVRFGGADVFVTGYISGDLSVGATTLVPEGTDIILARYTLQGFAVWAKRFGLSQEQKATALAVDAANNVYIAGSADGSINFGAGVVNAAGRIFLAKFDENGSHVWSKFFQGVGSHSAESLAIDPNGNVLFAGTFAASIDFGGGSLASSATNSMFVAKLDANGNHLWSKGFGDSGSNRATSIAATATSEVVVSGTTNADIDLGNGDLETIGGIDAVLGKFAP